MLPGFVIGGSPSGQGHAGGRPPGTGSRSFQSRFTGRRDTRMSPATVGSEIEARGIRSRAGATAKRLRPASRGRRPQSRSTIAVSGPPLQAWFVVPPPYFALPISHPSKSAVRTGPSTIGAKRRPKRASA